MTDKDYILFAVLLALVVAGFLQGFGFAIVIGIIICCGLMVRIDFMPEATLDDKFQEQLDQMRSDITKIKLKFGFRE
jgi:hypothetical protein